MNLSKPKVLVALSGGIHSAVTAALLKNQGYHVGALFLHFQSPNRPIQFRSNCLEGSDLKQAKALAAKIGITLHEMDVSAEFEEKVVDRFVHEVLQNRSPNPCIACHTQIKLRYLFDKASELGFENVATGHRSRVIQDAVSGKSGIVRLLRAVELNDDQSYFLFELSQADLRKLLMPLGGIPSGMIQKLANELEIQGIYSVDSPAVPLLSKTGICDEAGNQSAKLIESRVPSVFRAKGIIRTGEGRILGEHSGMFRYRLGSGKGLEQFSKDLPDLVVVGFDIPKQTVLVGSVSEIMSDQFQVERVNWLRPMNGLHGLPCEVKLHPNAAAVKCRLTLFENRVVQVNANEQKLRVIPGQAAVFYDGEEILGGGWVQK